MPETTHQLLQRVYTLLRRPSQSQLAYQDAQERMNANLRGYVQDMDLGGRDQRTEVALATIEAEDDDSIDYRITLPAVPDFEPVRLEYGPVNGQGHAWYAAQVVPYSTWESHYGQGGVLASFYGSSGLTEGSKVRLSVDPSGYEFRLSYRLPLLAVVQLGATPPIPTNFLPMLEFDTAVDCMSLVRNESDEWKAWVRDTRPIYVARAMEWRRRWEEYLNSSVEPAIQPLKRFDNFRMGGRRNPRAYLPVPSV